MRRATKLWIPPKPAIIRCAADVRRANFLPGWMPGAAGAGGGGAAEFPVVEATNSGELEPSTSQSVTLPSGIQAGDLLIIVFVSGSGTISASGWSTLFNEPDSSSSIRLVVFYKTAAGSDTATISNSSGRVAAYTTYRISGHQGVPEAQTTTGTSTTPDPPSLSPSWGLAKTLWIAAAGRLSSGVASGYPDNYTGGMSEVGAQPPIVFLGVSSAHRENEVASEDPGSFTFEFSAPWVAATIGIRPA